MSAWIAGPVAGPLVDGDLCGESTGGIGTIRHYCHEPAVVIGQGMSGEERLLCTFHADRHGIPVAA